MTLQVTHRGQVLTQEQINIVTEVMNKHMRGEVSKSGFLKACDQALEAAGLSVTTTESVKADCMCAEVSK